MRTAPSKLSTRARAASLHVRGKGAVAWRVTAWVSAFTLIELLVVIGIIALLSAIAVPSLKNLRQTDVMASANRQLLDDVASARQRAIANRTKVYMLFAPPADMNLTPDPRLSGTPTWDTLLANQQIAYTFFVRRTVGDQPGQENWRYLTRWHTLPEGVFIPDWKFFGGIKGVPEFETNSFPILTPSGVVELMFPYIAFDYQGRLVTRTNLPFGYDPNEVIPLARGNVWLKRDASGALQWVPPTTTEDVPGDSITNYNFIRIDWLTGRAKLERPEVQ